MDALDTYPHAPALGATDTSEEAAVAIAPAASVWRDKAMIAFRRYSSGFTAEELAAFLECERVTIQPRCSELRALGRIRDSGMRRLNGSGKRAIVWIAEVGE